jgi:hypothetical protein
MWRAEKPHILQTRISRAKDRLTEIFHAVLGQLRYTTRGILCSEHLETSELMNHRYGREFCLWVIWGDERSSCMNSASAALPRSW